MSDTTEEPRARFERVLRAAHAAGGQHVHLVAGQAPRARTRDALVTLPEPPLDAAALHAVARDLFAPARLERLPREGAISTTFRVDGQRFGRATLATNLGEPSLSVRFRTAGAPVTLEHLDAPPVVKSLLDEPHGLVLVAGPHASGKTSTVLALLDWLNRHRAVHVCTVEDPVAFEFDSDKALMQQREVGTDVPDVAAGVAAAMDQDLDVLAITALTDVESLTAALHAAETGHLVLLQVHAADARDALERLTEAAPASMQALVRRTLAAVLRGVVAQHLLPRASKEGRVALYEVLLPDDAVREALREGRPIAGLAGPGSVTGEDELARLVAAGTISAETARRAL